MIAPAKINLCLYLGPRRDDGLHELVSLFCPISLADRITVGKASGDEDEVECAAIPGTDLTARALACLREAGWRHAPLRIEVDKRIPVAAGLGGGSADAAAALRLASARGFDDDERIAELAAGLGADVPSQIDPRFALVGGAGERVTPLPEPPPFAAVVVSDPEGLATADVYAEADRLGHGRSSAELARMRSLLAAATASGAAPLDYRALLINDLAPAAISLRPAIAEALAALEGVGAELALVTGSGPTAVGLFVDCAAAEEAARQLVEGGRQAIVAESVSGL